MARLRPSVLGLLAASFLAGCDSDSVGPTSDLSADEAAYLAATILDQTFGFGMSAPTAAPERAAAGPSGVPVSFSHELSATLPCPVSGTVAAVVELSGVVDPEAERAELAYEVVQTHAACVVRSDDGTVRLTLDGAPDVTNRYTLEVQAGNFDATGAITGAVDWATDDASGRCEANLAFTGAGTRGSNASFSMTGTICGVTVSRSVTIGA